MGCINHDAIIVTGSIAADVAAGRDKAIALGLPCSDLVTSHLNGYVSFLIGPDGSKEFWDASAKGDAARAAWIAWARAGWTSGRFLTFVHVRYGEIEAERHDDGSEVTIAESQPDARSEQ
jgi:hypothetical protein